MGVLKGDVIVFRQLRHHQLQQNLSFELRWKARLQDERLANLEQLTRNENVRKAFDPLLDIPGLWDCMMLTTVRQMLAMKCDTVGKTRTLSTYSNTCERKSRGILLTSMRSGRT
jgi:hypothetical protein